MSSEKVCVSSDDFSATFDENSSVLTISINKPVNKRFVLAYNEILLPIRQSLKNSFWTSMVIINQECVLTPDAMSLVNSSVKHAETNGLLASAVVIEQPEIERRSRAFFETFYQQTDVQFAQFNNTRHALIWLKERLAANTQAKIA